MAALDQVQYVIADTWSAGAPLQITITPAAPTNGNSGIILYACASTLVSVTSIAQVGATWTRVVEAHAGHDVEIWKCSGFSGASTAITLTLSVSPGSAGTVDAAFEEVEGLITVDVTTAAANATSTLPSVSLTPAQSGRKYRMYQSMRTGANYVSGPNGGFTELTSPDGRVRTLVAFKAGASSGAAETCGWVTVSGGWEGVMCCILAPSTYTLNVITQPRCTKTGLANEATISVEILNGGVRDTGSVETLAVTKAAGVGTLSGTLTPIAPVLGVYTMSNVITTGATGVGTAPTLRFTSSVSAATVDSSSFIVRDASIYAFAGGYTPYYTYYHAASDTEVTYRLAVPAAAVIGTPLATWTCIHQAGFYGTDSASQQAAVLKITTDTAYGQWVDRDIATTFPYLGIITVIPTNTDTAKYGHRNALRGIWTRTVADGANLHAGKKYLYGFSTGAIEGMDMMTEDIWFYSALYTTDGSISSGHMCGTAGQGVPVYAMASAFFDPLWASPGGTPRHDLTIHTELARRFQLALPSFFLSRSNESSGLLPTFRDSFDMNDLFIPACDAVSTDFVQLSDAAVIAISPSTKRGYQQWPSTDHGATDAIIHTDGNRTALYAWLDNPAQTRTQFGPLSGGGGPVSRRRRRM